MAVPAQNQVDGVIVVQHVENVGRMSQEQRKPMLCRRRDASEVGAMERGIIHADDGELSAAGRNERTLVDQQGDFMPIRQLGIFRQRYTAVMVMVAERDKDRGDLPQA